MSEPYPTVDIWLIPLDDGASESGAPDCLDRAERERARRFVRPHHARRWAASRSALRRILACYVSEPADALRFRDAGNGKPALYASAARVPHFNLSHAGDYALLAVCWQLCVGVDIEAMRDMADLELIAHRFFSAREVQALLELPAARRRYAFFQCWTRKEAVLKATGAGIGEHLDRFTVRFGDEGSARMLEYFGSPVAASDWYLADSHCPPGYLGALAVQYPGSLAVRRMRYPADLHGATRTRLPGGPDDISEQETLRG